MPTSRIAGRILLVELNFGLLQLYLTLALTKIRHRQAPNRQAKGASGLNRGCGRDVDEVLVHTFGSTPIFTRSCESAMRLAVHYRENRAPSGLRWIKACPTNRHAAIAFAQARKMDEDVAQLAGYLH